VSSAVRALRKSLRPSRKRERTVNSLQCNDHGSLPLVQAVEACLQASSSVAPLELGAGERFLAEGGVALAFETKPQAPATVPAPLFEQYPIADRVHPREQLAPALERGSVLEDLFGCLLHEIVQIGSGPTRKGGHSAVEGFEQFALAHEMNGPLGGADGEPDCAVER
jgi:hypothetical protein